MSARHERLMGEWAGVDDNSIFCAQWSQFQRKLSSSKFSVIYFDHIPLGFLPLSLSLDLSLSLSISLSLFLSLSPSPPPPPSLSLSL